jgi:Protein of unknown function (DUF2917)
MSIKHQFCQKFSLDEKGKNLDDGLSFYYPFERFYMNAFTRVSGSFWLPSNHAMSLYPKQRSLLRVTCGRLWLTMAHDPLDYFMQTHDVLVIPQGAHVVIEPWGGNNLAQDAYFDWRVAD